MPPRRRPTYTPESIDQQLQQIHLLDPSSPSENLEQLGPIIKQILAGRHHEAYLRTLSTLIENKESEIEQICGENYEDFVTSTSTLLTVRQYTHNLQDKITTLDGSVASVGKALLSKKQELLQLKSTASNLDEAIDSLQACLRVLDVVQRVGTMIKEGRYWSALRSLDEVQNLPPSTLSQTPFFAHLFSSIPSLRNQVKEAVTAETKSWLSYIRHEVTERVGQLALEAMETRSRRWRIRQEKDPMLKSSHIGSAVELATNEGKEIDVLDNDKLKVDFKPLHQSIHIYSALGAIEELQRSYHADRKDQSTLILPIPLTLNKLPAVTQNIAGFFIIETHVIRAARNFRSEREVEELWEEAIRRLGEGVLDTLRQENDPEMFVAVKECLVGFSMTMESYGLAVNSIHNAILSLLDGYLVLLQGQIGKSFDSFIKEDDLTRMFFDNAEYKSTVLKAIWLTKVEYEDILKQPTNHPAPWSLMFYLCCKAVRIFASRFYRFLDGVVQHHVDVDEILGKALDKILAQQLCQGITESVASASALSQYAQAVTNLEYFRNACKEMEVTLPSLRQRNKGDIVPLPSFFETLGQTMQSTMDRINTTIRSKIDDATEEYDWIPATVAGSPSVYLYQLLNWLTSNVDSLTLSSSAQDSVYQLAVNYVAETMMGFIIDPSLTIINENGLANLLVDIEFFESQLKEIKRGHLTDAFGELKLTIMLPLENRVQEYLNPSIRQSTHAKVRPRRLSSILDKLAKYSLDRGRRDPVEKERGERRKREAEAVGRIYPGEGR